ncbi:MAG: CsgG/HfaB family protein [Bacteroidota bacterium]
MRFLVLLTMYLLWASLHASGQKKLLKEAAKLEEQGRYASAFDRYVDALHHNNTRTATQEALVRTSEQLMARWLNEYGTFRRSQATDEMMALAAKIEKHQQQLKYFGLETTLSARVQKGFKADRDSILDSWYNKAILQKKAGDYQRAAFHLNRIIEVDALYRDVVKQKQIVTTAPVFKEAKESYEQQHISKAWRLFSQIQYDDPNFSAAQEYMRLIKKHHSSTVSVLPSVSNFHIQEYKLRDAIVAALSQLNNPHIQMVDRVNLSAILEEQRLGVSGLVDESKVAEVGNLLGAEAVLFTKLMTYDFKKGGLQAFDKVAYKGFKWNGLTEYKAVNYKEYVQVNSLITSLQLLLVDSETSRILFSDIIHNEYEDIIRHAEYEGNYLTLYPAENDLIYKSGKAREDFLKLFQVKRNNKSLVEIDLLVQKEMAQKVALGVEEYFNAQR